MTMGQRGLFWAWSYYIDLSSKTSRWPFCDFKIHKESISFNLSGFPHCSCVEYTKNIIRHVVRDYHLQASNIEILHKAKMSLFKAMFQSHLTSLPPTKKQSSNQCDSSLINSHFSSTVKNCLQTANDNLICSENENQSFKELSVAPIRDEIQIKQVYWWRNCFRRKTSGYQ